LARFAVKKITAKEIQSRPVGSQVFYPPERIIRAGKDHKEIQRTKKSNGHILCFAGVSCRANLKLARSGQDEYLSLFVLIFNNNKSGQRFGQTEYYFPACTKPCSLGVIISDFCADI
jgi:hypothetical protein